MEWLIPNGARRALRRPRREHDKFVMGEQSPLTDRLGVKSVYENEISRQVPGVTIINF